jgi:uncharacterized protein (TIGR02569 family)
LVAVLHGAVLDPAADTCVVEDPRDDPPSGRVLTEFGLSGPVAPLRGGQRMTWRVGHAVLKRADLSAAAVEWQAEVLSSIDGNEAFRVAPPIRSADGRWLVSGWSAWRWESGHRVPRQWPRIVEVGSLLHSAISEVPAPEWLRDRTDIWAVADRVAWGESPSDDYSGVRHLAGLVEALRPLPGEAQLIHGDLTGNVLFDEQLPPLVIDVSPYWRPAAFASAVVVADALAFERAPRDVADALGEAPDRVQYLLRALIFRIVADHLTGRDRKWTGKENDPYATPVDLALHLALKG